ncbi:hypothetical protein Dhaf_3805 [Desulfitobacterium hafniense DCB-2]|uniref:Uncharacterized protein n=1 Tax=Desulfitobacterium hafniense (strain DSM 10664 / DCB-2) TaxID=272564 RepID=B8FRR1_DESHD|nr:hypothetical protein [Desulfitobacterium hafniense]ACL21821.1 hypothetical protein Dhaf_3805 [Desulfitobacterium hafniense DCB-2]
MDSADANKNKVRELFFFILCGLVLICSISFSVYVANLDEINNRILVMIYGLIIKPIIGVSAALLIAGLLAKIGVLNTDVLSAKAKKILFFIGLVLVTITAFYMLLMGLLCMGYQYAGTDNWVSAVNRSQLYQTLYQPFRSVYYKAVYFFYNNVGTLGALFLFFAKNRLENGIRERPNKTNIKKGNVGQLLFYSVFGLAFICGVIFRIYIEKTAESTSHHILTGIIYLVWVKPLVLVSAALLIAGLLTKIGLLNVDHLSAKSKKIIFIMGLIFVSVTVFYMLLMGLFYTGLQYAETDNWVKAVINSQVFIMLTKPFFSLYDEKMFLIRNTVCTIGALFLFVTINKS